MPWHGGPGLHRDLPVGQGLYREDNFILEVKAIGGKLPADQYEQQHAVSVKEYSFDDFVDA